jgi:tRNA modification GTPase
MANSPVHEDTIVAPATPPGEGGIAVIRISGPEALALADRLFRPYSGSLPSRTPPRTFRHGHAVAGPAGPVLDDALLLVFRAPASYTGEDSAEIQCHGSPRTVKAILDAAIASGARMAEPGEFTKRSFINGKMDLTQAEAVGDLIHARSERAARMAAAQLGDALGRRIRALYDALTRLSADAEAMLDFPDDELPAEVPAELLSRLRAISIRLESLLSTWNEGRILRDGLRVAIAGVPNTGKSTLLNLLSGQDKSIVSPYPGTTRDVIETEVSLHGYPVRLLDTAGLREAPDPVEQEGIRRARQAVDAADLLVCLVDASRGLSEEEIRFLSCRDPKTTLCLANKADLGDCSAEFRVGGHSFHSVSLTSLSSPESLVRLILEKAGLELTDSLARPLADSKTQTPLSGATGGSGWESGEVAVSSRHRKALATALEEMRKADGHLAAGREEDWLPAAMGLREAAMQMASILGRQWDEDTLDAVFSRFCVGK